MTTPVPPAIMSRDVAVNQKAKIVQELRAAKQGHVRWVRYASALIEGLEVLKDYVPVLGTECKFGQWYYGPGQALKSLPTYGKIEQPHLELHEVYLKIFKLLFDDSDKGSQGIFSRLLGKKKNKDSNTEEARRLFQKLEALSKVILAHLDTLEAEVIALNDDELDKLFYEY